MGKPYIPCAFRVYNKPICGQTETDPFQAMLVQAKGRGFEIEGECAQEGGGAEEGKGRSSFGFWVRESLSDGC